MVRHFLNQKQPQVLENIVLNLDFSKMEEVA
jgi:hypothetical protein